MSKCDVTVQRIRDPVTVRRFKMSRKKVFAGKSFIRASDFLDATNTDWYLLGIYLDLPHEQLSDIERRFSSHGPKRCKVEMYDLWIRTTPDASWEQIALALDKCGEQVLAEEVRKRHRPLPPIEEQEIQDDRETTMLAIKVEEETVKEFRKVERKFAMLACDIQTAIEEGNISLVRLQRFLREILKENGKFMQATTVEELFDKIRPHYCFLNTTILEDIVEEFFGEPLKEQLDTYEKQLNEFIESTKVSFLEEIDSKRTSDEAEMPQIVFKMSSRLADITIKRFQMLVRLIFEGEERALTHALVKKGCICVTWLTRESAIPSLVAHAQQKVVFMSLVGVLKLSTTETTIFDQEDDDISLQAALLLANNVGCADAVEFLRSLGTDQSKTKPTPYLQPTITPQHTERAKTMLAINIKARCGSPIGEEIPVIYQVPLQQVMVDNSSQIATYRFKFDQSTSSQEAAAGVAKLVDTSVESAPKVLMLVGATGAGKTTLINGMANYILGVNWEDNFRFNLTSKHSQSSWIIAYTFPKMDNSPLSHPLTIVDTPGFWGTDGVERNKRIAAQMKKFFSLPPPNSIDHINAIGLVALASLSHLTPSQQYTYQSILAMFGKDLGGNIFLMATFADGRRPPVLDAMKQTGISCVDTFKFNNSALYEKSDKNFWEMGIKNFRAALDSIHHVEPKSLQLTRDVLHEREHLEKTLQGLDTKIKVTLRKVDELQQEQQILQQHQRDVDDNKDFTRSVSVMRVRTVDLPPGQYATMCIHCGYTCHSPCSASSNGDVRRCFALSEGKCIICPNRCYWYHHCAASYRYEMYETTEQITYANLEHRYDKARRAMSATEKRVNDQEEELRKLRDAVFDMIQEAQTSLNQLKEISLELDPLLDEQKIKLLIELEKQQGAPGWEQHIDDLKAAQKKAQLLVKAGKVQSSDPQWWESFRV